MDVLTKEQRHKAMSHIKSKDTSIEVALRKALWKKGFRYRKNWKELPGHPDIAITKYRVAVFCDGELFHGKNWDVLKPKLQAGHNGAYWVGKIERNMQRDGEIDKALRPRDWTVIHFWGLDMKKDVDACVNVIEEHIFDKQVGDWYEEC